MKTLNTLKLKLNGDSKTIYFGIPDTEEEEEKMFRLRYNAYSLRGYINPSKYKDGIETDEYDKDNKSIYFIAKVDDKVTGTVRIIKDNYLPTEKECFEFNEPEEIKKIERNNRGELGRLIVIPYEEGKYFPRNIILLFLVKSLIDYGLQHDIRGGYAFIKESLKKKLEKLKFPIHYIFPYKQIYPAGGILYGYFTQKDNRVIPIYFLTNEFSKFIEKLVDKKLMFSREIDNTYILRENFYNKFLKALKII